MILGLLAAILFAPLYWLLVPQRWRREVLGVASLIALGCVDRRLPFLLIALCVALAALLRAIAAAPERARAPRAAVGLAALAALFVWNKLTGDHMSVLPSQAGLAFLGISFLVIKASGALIDTARGTIPPYGFGAVLAWIVFLPTYPAGPMETLDHFAEQAPRFDRARALGGLERILFGLVKALLVSAYLGIWAAPLLDAPDKHGPLVLLAGLYAFSLRFYFDFSGYSDIAIGLSALFGYDIDENFDHPFLRRNIAQLWQHWHMTLTRWLRTYLFIPVARRVMRHGGRWGDRIGIAAGQIVAMTVCGLWHGVTWNFAVWGLLQAVGLIWVGVIAREVGRRMPPALVVWWRQSWAAYGVSMVLTFNFFSFAVIYAMTDVGGATRYLARVFSLG
jgi:alginate O-acetyltransferase complex protein AlgI